MRLAPAIVVVGALGSLVACSHEHATEPAPLAAAISAVPPGPTAAGAPVVTPAETECAGLAPPVALSDAKDVRDVQLVGSAVFFQSGSTIFRVGKDGKGLTTVFTSPNLVRGYVDGNALLAIESSDDDTTTATLRIITATSPLDDDHPFPDFTQPAADPADPADPAAAPDDATDPNAAPPLPGTTTATDFAAAGTEVFASDDGFFYLLADGADDDTLVQVSKAAPQPQTVIALPNVLTHPQLRGTDIWYVQDQQRVFKVTIDDGNPEEVFGIGYAPCELAVNETSAFCSVGTAVERRDLTGANPTTLVDSKTSKTSAPFGALLALDSTLFVPSSAPDPNLKNVIFSLTSTTAPTQKFIACGRGVAAHLTVDPTSVAWTEDGGGVFIAPR